MRVNESAVNYGTNINLFSAQSRTLIQNSEYSLLIQYICTSKIVKLDFH